MGGVTSVPVPDLSVVVPVYNEADSIVPLVTEIRSALDGRVAYELIYVDDGSTDATPSRLAAVASDWPALRAIRHDQRCGQSTAIRSGVKAARGRWIATLDGDGQNDPADIPALLAVARQHAGGPPLLVAGHRHRRQAGWHRRVSSKVANHVRDWLLGDGISDTGCGLKVFARDDFLDLPYFDHMHRFLPALVLRSGGRVVQVPVSDRPRTHGRTKYGIHDRLWAGLVDLLGVLWLQRRARHPVFAPLHGQNRRTSDAAVAAAGSTWVLVWGVLVALALTLRPPLPIDETRYLSVAWEMWVRGDYLVPYLNGQPYSDKPPLLFWMMQLGWAVFGVTDWWARLVAPIFGLASMALTPAIARRLWPHDRGAAGLAPWILLGTAWWTVFITPTTFDTLVTFFVLLGILGILRAGQESSGRGWTMLSAAVGLGILTKGPMILLYMVPIGLAAPWWTNRRGGWLRWYSRLTLAIALGLGIALAWAVPAALSAGEPYARAIFWDQTSTRLGQVAEHRRAFWWYAPLVPALVFPWPLAPVAWRGWRAALATPLTPATRLLLAWIVPPFLILSLVGGKQAHYLLPLLPAFALLTAHGISVLGAIVTPGRIRLIAMLSPALMLLLHLAVLPYLAVGFDVAPLARKIHSWQEAGRPVAHAGRYHGQFQYAGRLEQPLEVIPRRTERDWLARHPGGKVISHAPLQPGQGGDVEYSRRLRKWTVIVLLPGGPAAERFVDGLQAPLVRLLAEGNRTVIE